MHREGFQISAPENITKGAGLTPSWILPALLLIATVWLYRTPYNASNLEVPPDTVEYALAPLQLLETGRYEIMVEGRGLPPRYPPWFPALVILPAYVLFGHDPGNAILPVTLLAVAGIGFAYGIGKRLSSTTGGVLAALTVLMLPPYSNWASQVMTDVPCTALMLGACLLYLYLRSTPHVMLPFLGAGALVAITTLFRPVFAAMLLPFLLAARKPRKGSFFRGLLLLAPMGAAAAATLAYNSATFGSPLRNGYKFWMAVPMDYYRMVFSLSFIRENLEVVAFSVLPILLLVGIGAWLLARARMPASLAASSQSFQHTLTFFALTTVPILLFHLLYFFPRDRFHIPMMAGVSILAASMVALLIGPRKEAVFKALLPAVFLLVVAARIAAPSALPLRRLAADRVRALTPENAIVISAIDPVYLARMAASGSSRRIVPLSRNVEYASKLLVRKRVEDPRLSLLNWEDPRARAVIRPHAEEAVRFVASERVDELVKEVASGTPVFFESTYAFEVENPAVTKLAMHLSFTPRASNLYELRLP